MTTSTSLTEAELAIAAATDAQQCVLIGSQSKLADALKQMELFTVDEAPPSPNLGITFVRTHFESEALSAALAKSHFDKLKSSLFLWLGGAGYRSIDAAVDTLAYVASLPKGSGVLLDYVTERTSLRALADTALDALASRVSCPDGVKYLIQPQAVAAMLRSLGFHHIDDLPGEEGAHLVSAMV